MLHFVAAHLSNLKVVLETHQEVPGRGLDSIDNKQKDDIQPFRHLIKVSGEGRASVPIDPITLEVIRNRFDVIAEEMELTLPKSSHSTIVKEGLDASEALFTADGQTITQATGIPIHLGALILAVEAILKKFPPTRMQPGDMFVVNDPYAGGTHLPDVVVRVAGGLHWHQPADQGAIQLRPVVHGVRRLLCAAMCCGRSPIPTPPTTLASFAR
jgi:hypothetical protein